MPKPESSILQALDLHTGYGKRDVFTNLSFSLKEGQLLGLVGHNGAGKSTLLRAMAGTLPLRNGDIRLAGNSIAQYSVRQRIECGLTYLPQGNPVFSRLTVRDNLILRVSHASSRQKAREAIAEMLESFPQLCDRQTQLAGTLSGGEKQMLSLAGALLTRPKFLLLDEPCLGLAPALVSKAFSQFRDLASQSGVGILLVEQKIREVLRTCDRFMVMRQGKIILEGPCSEIGGDEDRLREMCL